MVQSEYSAIWSRLNRIDLEPLAENPPTSELHPEFSAVLQYFLGERRTTFANVRALTSTQRSEIESHGIEVEHLVGNLENTINQKYRDSRGFQLTAVRKKAVYAVCPFTGKLVATSHSLLANLNTIFYRF